MAIWKEQTTPVKEPVPMSPAPTSPLKDDGFSSAPSPSYNQPSARSSSGSLYLAKGWSLRQGRNLAASFWIRAAGIGIHPGSAIVGLPVITFGQRESRRPPH